MKRIIFTVTNDLNYDQRMQRICGSLAANGYAITLVGRKLSNSRSLDEQPFLQKRLYCFFEKGPLFYAVYNIRLFCWLLFQKLDVICAIDLDTILPCYFISVFRKKKRVYDAHELFTEQKEIVTRPSIHRFWLAIEKFTVPKFRYGYTVSESVGNELRRRYGTRYEVIRNFPNESGIHEKSGNEKYIIYQGAVNEARGLENLVLAMHQINVPLHIYGDGNIYDTILKLIKAQQLQDKVLIKGKMLPAELQRATANAYIGLNLIEPLGLNQYYSLANKFFDYIQEGIPQLTMNFPEYQKINQEYEVAVLINDIGINEIVASLNRLLNDQHLYNRLKNNCMIAREIFHWKNEEKKLLFFYNDLLDESH